MIKNSNSLEVNTSVIQVLPTKNQKQNENHIKDPTMEDHSSTDQNIDQEGYSQHQEESVSYRNSLYSFVILGVCLASSSTQTLIPWHNLFIKVFKTSECLHGLD